MRERPMGSGAWVRERGEGGAAPKHLEHLPVHEGALREVQVKLALHMTRQPGGGRGARWGVGGGERERERYVS